MGFASEHEKLVGIQSSHSLRAVSFRAEQKRGFDSDIYLYEEVDRHGEVVAVYEVKESMSIYPPFKITTSWKRSDGF